MFSWALPKINEVLDIAGDVGINVILLAGGGKVMATNASPTHGDDQANDYADYLEVLAANLDTRTELLAYDLFNEPSNYIAQDLDEQNRPTKNEICNYSETWYDAIKSNDANHLVTIGDMNMRISPFYFDPAILSVDFYSYHFYPHEDFWEHESYDQDNINERIDMAFYWLNNYCHMPWIVGETAASAWTENGQDVTAQNTNSSAPGWTTNSLLVGKNLSVLPWMWGDYNDQRDFARDNQQAAINYGSSGYSWWAYMDQGVPSSAAVDDGIMAFYGQYEGLLQRGDPETVGNDYVYDNSLDKPIVDASTGAFGTGSNAVTAPSAPGNMPTNYYNPYQGNISTNYSVSGTIEDNNSPTETIKDAIITAANFWGDESPPIPPDVKFSIFTFSDENGDFDLISPIPESDNNLPPSDPDYVDYARFLRTEYTASAASKARLDWWQLTPTTSYHPSVSITLDRQENVFDKKLSSITVNIGQTPAPFTARHILTVESTVVQSGGTADFHASTEVDLKPGFESVQGSQTIVYISPVAFECTQLVDNGSVAYKTDEVESGNSAIPKDKSIEVSYQLLSAGIQVVPNPASDKIFIEIDMPAVANVEIVNYTGSIVYSEKQFINKSTPVSVAALASGCYFVKVSTNNHTEIFKLIINKI